MGYGGKFVERDQARQLRAQSWTLQEIADELGVSKSSVSVWVRDVDFVATPRNRGHSGQRPHPSTCGSWQRSNGAEPRPTSCSVG